MSLNTSTALFTFPKDLGGLQIKMPRAIMCSATWGHLTRCCQFDDGTRQLAEITYKDALEKHGCLDMEDLQFEAEFLTWDQASQNSFTFACHLTSTIGIRISWDPFNPDWIASAANMDLAQVMIDTQHLIRMQIHNEQKWASHPPRGHPTYLPHPSPNIVTTRAKLRIWLRGEKTGQEKDRMGPSNMSPPSSTTGIEEPLSLR